MMPEPKFVTFTVHPRPAYGRVYGSRRHLQVRGLPVRMRRAYRDLLDKYDRGEARDIFIEMYLA